MSDNNEPAASDELFTDLKKSAELLVKKLENSDFVAAKEVIQAINDERDQSIYKEVGRLTRGIHDAIVNFNVDLAKHGVTANVKGKDGSEMADATDRLEHVIKLCQDAANTTMDMVEEGIPISQNLSQEAATLREKWGRLIRREMDPGEFRELYKRIDVFLSETSGCAGLLNEKFNTILLAQGYQDLSGQIIQKVTGLVQEVEKRLVELVTLASQVEQITGIVEVGDETGEESLEVEGPQINPLQRADVVSGQDEVDDLLSSLGF